MDWVKEFFNTKIKGPLISVFKQGLSPEVLALSFAFGITGGVFPLPGITTIVCFVFIYFFRLNVAATQIINFLMTPVGLACFIPWIKLGNWVLGVNEDISGIVSLFSEQGILTGLRVAGSSVLRGIFAWLIVLPFLTIALYYILLVVVKRFSPRRGDHIA